MELNASALWDLSGAQGWWQGAHYRLPAAEPGAKGEATGISRDKQSSHEVSSEGPQPRCRGWMRTRAFG